MKKNQNNNEISNLEDLKTDYNVENITENQSKKDNDFDDEKSLIESSSILDKNEENIDKDLIQKSNENTTTEVDDNVEYSDEIAEEKFSDTCQRRFFR